LAFVVQGFAQVWVAGSQTCPVLQSLLVPQATH